MKTLVTYLCGITLFLLFLPLNVCSQKYPTRFLGFPVDGPKATMIKNLESVGFEYHLREDCFTGYYFGEPVYVFLKVRDYKVNRVLLYEITQRDSSEIKQRFNQTYKLFKKDDKYVYMEDKDAKIAPNENITMGISHYSRNYKAVFGQKQTTPADSIAIQKKASSYSNTPEIDTNALKSNFRERCRRIHARALARSVSTTDDRFMNQVWFAISEKFGKYALIYSYDNLYNFTQPTDEEEEE